MIILVILFSTLFILSNLLILVKLKEDDDSLGNNRNSWLDFSLLIPFKNEGKNLIQLLKSINKLDYPQKAYEILLINDNSTDNFLQIIENNLESKVNFRLLTPINKKLPAKKGALDFGLKNSKNNFIITTDADAILPQSILKIYSNKFHQDYDILFGPTHLICNNSFAGRLSQFYNLRNQILIFSASKCRIPYSAMGSNLSYKKESFLKLGGYENFSEVISGDDDLLIREGIKNNLKVGSILSKDLLVKSNTVNTFKEFLNQKARHTATSNYYLLKHQILLSVWHLINIFSLFSPIFMIMDSIFAIPFILKIIFDITIIKSKEKIFEYKFTFLEVIKFQIIYEILLIVNYINGSLKRYNWK